MLRTGGHAPLVDLRIGDCARVLYRESGDGDTQKKDSAYERVVKSHCVVVSNSIAGSTEKRILV